MSAESPGPRGFRAFVRHALRPKKSRQLLRKDFSASSPDLRVQPPHDEPPLPSLAPLEAHRLRYLEANAQKDTQRGENRDHTAILHAIGAQETDDTLDQPEDEQDRRPPGDPLIASLSASLWQRIAEFLSPAERASLTWASKTLFARLDGPAPWLALNEPENLDDRADFLVAQDRHFPHHLLCFACAIYHRRTREGRETLQPADVVNPLVDCPQARNALRPPPRHRIAPGRNLPFAFAQLVLRAHRFGSLRYGLSVDSLARRWRRDGWSHHSRYLIHHGHLLMRVVSSCFAPPDLPPSSKRLLLYSREDYWPYFSVCAHWRDGELMTICKCALGHVPVPRDTSALQGLEHRGRDVVAGRVYNPNALATLCGRCRPMRRCPQCPSEYLVEVKLTEDRSDPRSPHFRHAIVVTRWCDLGDGSSPRMSIEWAACNGLSDEYDSFAQLGKRSLSGIFESAMADDIMPGQRLLSMNPKGKKLGEEGTGWY
ncbi:hypothetical protein EYZ11_008788 [Aspergillus tanneri]|uniref:F-box domain-containing protein n=1 Tax=Aspergillus tanneri TaxID=1220188 RepID=A0A4S3JBR7_9EURO|nr:uncharacterized protein ATNIH1004_004569 [Aspergillus tanneri]KAA8648684.1 hypothetical protein ATNIH1004_004569 [Aspergillus tanneri]THC91757.1 hypothetical protein EYZ11_008788 [Aspergillus tanneri]